MAVFPYDQEQVVFVCVFAADIQCQFYRFVACLPSKERYELTTLEPIVKQSNSLCTLLKDSVTEENARQFLLFVDL